MSIYTRLTITECGRCAAFVLGGHVSGLPVRVDTHTVPAADANVLHRYGHLVLVVDIGLTGLWADFYTPATHTGRHGRYLLTTHTCTRARARRTPQLSARPAGGAPR